MLTNCDVLQNNPNIPNKQNVFFPVSLLQLGLIFFHAEELIAQVWHTQVIHFFSVKLQTQSGELFLVLKERRRGKRRDFWIVHFSSFTEGVLECNKKFTCSPSLKADKDTVNQTVVQDIVIDFKPMATPQTKTDAGQEEVWIQEF